ncbi:response regulator [Microlunatus soli]|uniref:DNA-binding response regulator, NarL/FixJ family, contains REC and HTH domains n=1 Tax=Microlunatus soli TaxID=630515 RepID=A0A1H1SZX7_9ACTN|nr:response regulator transcription factor [Microlunatus soli]SDS53448.1 DNA-binding response regulator, NarL/FixJ family, contains REC and HTH domains [Microlunatus soli]
MNDDATAPGSDAPGSEQTGSGPISVLLVDDQDLVRYGFGVILGMADGIEVVGEASDGRQAIDRARTLHPDVILMDVQMPVLDGLAATRELVADPAVGSAVLILTTFDRDDYLYQALQAGASGFLLKNASPENLIEAVRVVAGGDALLAPAVTKRVIARFATGTGDPAQLSPGDHERRPAAAAHPDRAAAHIPQLTERESDVLALIAQGKSNAEIAAELVVGEATVKTHVSNLLAKLQLRDRIQAVIYAYEHGIVTPVS